MYVAQSLLAHGYSARKKVLATFKKTPTRLRNALSAPPPPIQTRAYSLVEAIADRKTNYIYSNLSSNILNIKSGDADVAISFWPVLSHQMKNLRKKASIPEEIARAVRHVACTSSQLAGANENKQIQFQ